MREALSIVFAAPKVGALVTAGAVVMASAVLMAGAMVILKTSSIGKLESSHSEQGYSNGVFSIYVFGVLNRMAYETVK